MIFKLLDKNKKNNISDENNDLIKVISLLVHAARIDGNYSEKEKNIIINFTELFLEKERERNENLKNLSQKEIVSLVEKAEEYEKNSNQILDFTKEVKNMNEDSKIKIVEILWNIIYSDKSPDMYENSLMRRLTGLLYLDAKIVGDIKEKVINNLK